MRARLQIAAMEGVLERAVQLGAQRLIQQVQAVSSDMLFIARAARAKGFWLDGYGVFFDVDVPAMRRAWPGPSARWIAAVGRGARIQTLRRNLQSCTTRRRTVTWKRPSSGWSASSVRR